MARKHEKFSWSGYRYAPESFYFSLNGKAICLPHDTRTSLAYLIIAGKEKEAEDELKRILRKDEKKPQIVGNCIIFFKEDSNEFYYTKDLQYQTGDLQEALRCYKEWKHYILDRNCMLETGYTVEEGDFKPFGNNIPKRKAIISKVDLTRVGFVRFKRRNIFNEL